MGGNPVTDGDSLAALYKGAVWPSQHNQTHNNMGNFFQKMAKVFSDFGGSKKSRGVIVGLDAAGKTTILYKLKLNEAVHTIPTIGFNVETVQHKNVSFTMWDVGGQDKIRGLWHHYFMGTNGVIFVVDSNDRDRLEEARDELNRVLSADELRGCCVLVLANKQDLPKAMSPTQIADGLGLHKLKDRHWYIQASTATTGEGMHEGIDW